jgi:transcriptional regulator with XRE-family HTH domain
MDEIQEVDIRIKQIGERIKELRVEKGYSSYEFFAWDNSMSRVQYYKMEAGSNITIKSLLKVIDAHGITLQEFFNGISNETVKPIEKKPD